MRRVNLIFPRVLADRKDTGMSRAVPWTPVLLLSFLSARVTGSVSCPCS
jgi:hypothetical protein